MMQENLLAHNPVCLPVLVDDSISTEMIDRKQTIRFIYYSISTLSSVHFEDCFLAAIRLAAMLERFSRNDTGMQYAATIEETESTKQKTHSANSPASMSVSQMPSSDAAMPITARMANEIMPVLVIAFSNF